MKSHLIPYLTLLKALFSDLCREYPQLARKVGKTYDTLSKSTQHHGLEILTIVLPEWGKQFESFLENGAVKQTSLKFERKSAPWGPLPCKEFWELVFDEDGLLRESVNPKDVAVLRQIFYLFKKVKLDCKQQRVFDAVKQFMDTEQELPLPTIDWENPDEDQVRRSLKELSFDNFINPSILSDQQWSTITSIGEHYVSRRNISTLATSIQSSRLSSQRDMRDNTVATTGIGTEFNLLPEQDTKDQPKTLEVLSYSIGELLTCLQRVSDILVCQIGTPNIGDLVPRNGPGVNSDGPRFRDKLSTGVWTDKIDTCFPFSEYALHNYGASTSYPEYRGVEDSTTDEEQSCSSWDYATRLSWYNLRSQDTSRRASFSRLISVPKTQKGPRLIAAEPTCNMFVQQSLWAFLQDRVEATWIGNSIKFRDQSQNQRMAAEAATAGYATVDLSEASDRLSCYVVERLFRRNPRLLAMLMASRTSVVRQEIDAQQPEFVYLRKYAAMGNATTFPVESIVFLAFALTALLTIRKIKPTERTLREATSMISVFGDDIICPVEAYLPLHILLETFKLKVNTTKTFWKGIFRESCGADYFGATDVTPAYIRQVCVKGPDDVTSLVEVRNNFYFKGYWCVARTLEQIADAALPNHVSRKKGRALQRVGIPRVRHTSGVWGYRSFCNADPDIQQSWNRDLQKFQHRCLQPKSVSKYADRLDDKGLLQYFLEVRSTPQEWRQGWILESGQKLRPSSIPIELL